MFVDTSVTKEGDERVKDEMSGRLVYITSGEPEKGGK